MQTFVKLTLPKTLRPRRTDRTTCLDPSLYRIPSASLSRSKHTISLTDASLSEKVAPTSNLASSIRRSMSNL